MKNNESITQDGDEQDVIPETKKIIQVQKIGFFTKKQPLTVTNAGPGTSC